MFDSKLFQQVIEGTNFPSRSYSGRGMYGRECIGVALSPGQETGEFFAECLVSIRDQGLLEDGLDLLEEILRNWKADNLGRGTILYFPQFQYPVYEGDDDSLTVEEEFEQDENLDSTGS